MLIYIVQALARAVYAKKKLVILDDPFSGLDTSTENHIFHSLMGKSGLWREMRLTVLITSSSGKNFDFYITTDYANVISQTPAIQ